MEECTHNCSTCGSTCSSREEAEQKPQLNQISKVKHVIGIVSGKGGVGKSLVSSLLAAESQRRGFRTAIMDADLTGPSIPQAFGLHEKIRAVTDERFEAGGYMIPAKTESGIQVLSVNLLLPKETDPVIWRGAVIASTITQFWTDVFWDDIDYSPELFECSVNGDVFNVEDTAYFEALSYEKQIITSITFGKGVICEASYALGNKEYNFDKGYFDWKTMGFGEVIEEEDILVDKIIEYIENDCIMEDKYKERVDKFFKYNDKNNCKRVYDWILEH